MVKNAQEVFAFHRTWLITLFSQQQTTGTYTE